MIASIVTIVRDESDWIEDFIAHHIDMGFDTIYLFDDLSVVPVAEVVRKLPEVMQGKVVSLQIETDFYDWDGQQTNPLLDKEIYELHCHSKQMYFLNWALKHIVEADDWVAFFDVDEFLWIPAKQSVKELCSSAVCQGASAVVFDALLYGHGFNLSRPSLNSVCSYIWSGDTLVGDGQFGYCKFIAHAGALQGVSTPHFPDLPDATAALGPDWLPRERYKSTRLRLSTNSGGNTHLKHLITQDVHSCFERKLRSRISTNAALVWSDSAWADKIMLLASTSFVVNVELAAWIVFIRAKYGMEMQGHLAELSRTIGQVEACVGYGASLDFDFLRQTLRMADITDGQALYHYFTNKPQRGILRFETLPKDFSYEFYRRSYSDLANFSERRLMQHYLTYGRKEGRNYK